MKIFSATYLYDELSRITSENRIISALTGDSPNYGSYGISYEYTLSGQLKKVTDPFSSPTNLSYDSTGRPQSVTGSFNGTNYCL
jgi:YD repeat-containing protein